MSQVSTFMIMHRHAYTIGLLFHGHHVSGQVPTDLLRKSLRNATVRPFSNALSDVQPTQLQNWSQYWVCRDISNHFLVLYRTKKCTFRGCHLHFCMCYSLATIVNINVGCCYRVNNTGKCTKYWSIKHHMDSRKTFLLAASSYKLFTVKLQDHCIPFPGFCLFQVFD